MKWLVLAALLLANLAAAAGIRVPPLFTPAQVAASGLTEAQAEQLALLAARHDGFKLGKHGMFIEKNAAPVEGVYSFTLQYDSTQALATQVLGWYLVSRSTGNVIEGHKCTRFDFAGLRKIQTGISQRTGKQIGDESGLLDRLC
jgi:hypothetical protein